MKRVLVTGATGFIGRHALKPLHERGFEVHAVARRPPSNPTDYVGWHTADLLDIDQRQALVEQVGATHLLHLAWYAEPGAFWAARENASWVSATVSLVDEFAGAGGHRAVLAGTCAEYDWRGAQPLREDSPIAPATFYGVCKDATRRVVSALGETLGIETAWGRIFFLYGPGEDERRLVASVAHALVAGERAATSDGSQLRDFLHVDDVALAFAAIVDSDVLGAVNVGSGCAVPVRHLIELIALAADRPDLLDIGALPARASEPPTIVADITRLCEEVGYVSVVPLDSGVGRTVAWWRDRAAAQGSSARQRA